MRRAEWNDGRRNGVKWAITWLHRRAKQMRDPKAADILNVAASDMGWANRDPEKWALFVAAEANGQAPTK